MSAVFFLFRSICFSLCLTLFNSSKSYKKKKQCVNTQYLINNPVNLSAIYIYSLNSAAIYILRKMYTLNTFISVPF